MQLTQQIEEVRTHLYLLQARRSERAGTPIAFQADTLADEALEELSVVADELQAADEELLAQNEQLALALQMASMERNRYQELFDQAPDAYIVTDMHGTIRAANLTASAMFRASGMFLAGKPLVVFIADPDRRVFRRALLESRRFGEVMDLELCVQPREGWPVDVEIRAMIMRNDAGDNIGLRWLFRDVTERRTNERKITQLNAELETRVDERTAQLAEALRSKDLLLVQEQAARMDAEHARTRLLVLSQASELLAASLDYDVTLASVARLLVNQLADCCLIFLAGEDDVVRQVASAHLDPRKEKALGELAVPNAFRRGSPGHLVSSVIDSGEPVMIDAGAGKGEPPLLPGLNAPFGDLAWGSLMVVPLVVRGKAIGAISLATRETDHSYTADDLDLARELAHRAAQAIDNARLFSLAQKEIQERKQADEALRRTNQSLEALIEASPLAVVQIDMNGVVRLWSPAAENIFGWSAQEVLGEMMPVFEGASRERFLEMVRGELAGPGVAEMEVKCLRKNGEPVDVGCWSSRICDAAGVPVGVLGLVADFSERKRISDELQEATVEAREASRAKDQFLAILSHELRTPLTAVLGAVYALKEDPELSPACRPMIDLIGRNMELETRLIDDLLDVTRIIKGKLPLHVVTVDAHELLQNVVSICRDDASFRRLDLSVQLNASMHHVQADPARLQQVFWNLLKNAIKFTPEGGEIIVRTMNEGDDRILVEVADTGIGIEPELMPRIFNAFEQGGEAITRRFGGLGLGLAVSRMLVEQLGGALRVASPGRFRGSVFTIDLMAVPEAGVAQPGGAHDQPMAMQPEGKRRILFVEDHIDTSRVLTMMLSHRGYDVTAVHSMSEALAIAGQREFDLLISDIGLPDGSGLEVIQALNGGRPEKIKGIALSGYGMEEDVRRSMEAGFSEHLIKPINVRKLLDTIRQLV